MSGADTLASTLDDCADYWHAHAGVLVLHGGRTELCRCYGLANRELNQPFTEHTRISLHCSGGFSALCALLLRKHKFLSGELPPDKSVARLIDELTGMSVAGFIAEYVFTPLGTSAHTSAPSDALYLRYVLNKNPTLSPAQAGTDSFTVSLSELESFAKALVWGGLLPKGVQHKAETERSLCGRMDGLHSFFCDDWLRICYSRELGTCFVYLRNETTREEKRNSNWLSFYKDLRREITAAYILAPQAPKVVRYGRNNALPAMNILVTDEQLQFVADARTTLCSTFARQSTDRAFVLMERTQAVGLARLHLDLKKREFEIAILQIDKRFQGRGYGRYFLDWCINYLRENGAHDILLSCNEYNTVALALYESAGFARTGAIKSECAVLRLAVE